ncbi:hypothetical protein T4A_10808 [Trichinella pseudospiralis]|uniref:Uncharacterized protein n=1 Tax=Trichinella pseudospiralis TaxID=6337 RepID=A0A0V1EBN3_TRIPS|nr:hypothetical protein T4A_10808 [Trichinella pseudospiralis]
MPHGSSAVTVGGVGTKEGRQTDGAFEKYEEKERKITFRNHTSKLKKCIPIPDLQNWDPWGTAYTVCLHCTLLLRVVLDLLPVVRVFTSSVLHCPYL